MKNKILAHGVYVAALTPMQSDLKPDIDLLANHCRNLLERGVQGLALMGTTGEANSFSIEERMEIVEGIIGRQINANQIMLGTGCCSYIDTVRLTRHALAQGIKSILLLPPFYYKQVDDEGLFNYFYRVVNEVGEHDLEIYLYHFPKMTGLHFSSALLEKLLTRFPDNFAGMKDSSGDFSHMKSICENFTGFKLFAGTEKYLLDVLRLGGAGCISATANVTTPKCMEVFNHWQGAMADRLQSELTTQRNIFEGLPFIGILKQYMAHISGNPQWLHVRPPNGLVAEIELKRVIAQMANWS